MAYTNLPDMTTEEIVNAVRSRRLKENSVYQYNKRTKGIHKNVADALKQINEIRAQLRAEARVIVDSYVDDRFYIN